MEIKTVEFTKDGIKSLEKVDKGTDWPVVYIIHNDKEAYIGETCNAMNRLIQHIGNRQRRDLDTAEIIIDDEFNKSAILDTEQTLIRLCKSDKRFRLQNISPGQSPSHEYYNRIHYEAKMSVIWEMMLHMHLAKTPHDILVNKAIYKYSPYTSLTTEQVNVYSDILKDIKDCLRNDKTGTFVVHGCAGTGKTILAMSLLRTLVNLMDHEVVDLIIDMEEDVSVLNGLVNTARKTLSGGPKVAFCTPVTELRNVLEDVVSESELGENLVLSPEEIARSEQMFDVVIVDESHRLKIRKNIQNYKQFDDCSKLLGLDPKECSQLDWIMNRSKYRVLLYDEEQSVKGSDLGHERFLRTVGEIKEARLKTQMRCLGGKAFVDYIGAILDCENPERESFGDGFEFRLFDDVGEMISLIKEKDRSVELCRTVAGYSWEWKEKNRSYEYKKEHGIYDIQIDGHKYIWNTSHDGWILSDHAIDEIGCIHSTQGFDLNYVGVIFGREIDYNPKSGRIEIDKNLFFDRNVKAATKQEELETYILNTYRVLLTRGIKGCYVYACNKNMRNYLKRFVTY